MRVEESSLTLTRHVYQLCGLPMDRADVRDTVNQNPISELQLQDLLSALSFIAGQVLGLSVTTTRQLLPASSIKNLHSLFNDAYSVFEDWPNNYYHFIDWKSSEEKNIPSTQKRSKSVLYADFGKFYTGLYNILSASQFDFMKVAFVEYLIKRWGYRHVPHLKLKSETTLPQGDRYVSKIDAMHLLQIDDEQADQLIEMGRLKSMVRSKGKKRLIFVELMDIARLIVASESI